MKKIIINILFLLYLYFVATTIYKNNTILPDSPEEIKMAKAFHYEFLKDPEQTPYFNPTGKYIQIKKDNYDLQLYPQANYRIYAMVMSKNRYWFNWDSKVAPYDLALAWNDLTLPQNQEGIRYSQSNRWYYYQYTEKFPLSPAYIIAHSANTHIIPANNKVFQAIEKVHAKQKIYLEGYLVFIRGKVGNGNITWNSSLTRFDSGDHSCEVMYVKRAILDGKIYD